MKKIGLLTTLLITGLLLTGCNKTIIENTEIIDDCVSVDGEDACAVDIDEPDEDIPEGGGERITVVTDMCREQLGEIDYIEYGDGICRFNENERCYLNELADGNCRNEKLYNEFLDTIKSSGEQPQIINDYPEE